MAGGSGGGSGGSGGGAHPITLTALDGTLGRQGEQGCGCMSASPLMIMALALLRRRR